MLRSVWTGINISHLLGGMVLYDERWQPGLMLTQVFQLHPLNSDGTVYNGYIGYYGLWMPTACWCLQTIDTVKQRWILVEQPDQ